jgi:hypothetical protein
LRVGERSFGAAVLAVHAADGDAVSAMVNGRARASIDIGERLAAALTGGAPKAPRSTDTVSVHVLTVSNTAEFKGEQELFRPARTARHVAMDQGARGVYPVPHRASGLALCWLASSCTPAAGKRWPSNRWCMAAVRSGRCWPNGAAAHPVRRRYLHQSHVRPGDLLMRLSNPERIAQRALLASRLEGLLVGQVQPLLGDASAAHNLAVDIEGVQAELQRANEGLRTERNRVTIWTGVPVPVPVPVHDGAGARLKTPTAARPDAACR